MSVWLATLHSSCSGYLTLCNLDVTAKVCLLRNVKMDSILLDNFKGVNSLIFFEAQTSKIPQQIIDRFPPLQKLDLSQNKFTELVFDDIKNTLDSLATLDASNNNITTLAANTFAKTPNLKELFLSRNQITALPSTVFFTMSKLTLLDLSHNQIKTIAQDNMFGFLRQLKFIYLNHNGISKLRTSFGNVTNLVEFDGSHNELKDWSLTFASGSTVKLNLAYCGLTNSYSSAADKEELNLEGNMIEIMRITGKVTRLRANNNLIRQLEIDPSIKLEALELANNVITDIGNITKVDALQVLDLSNNKLKNTIKGDIFKELTALTYLSIRDTGATITPDLFEKNTRLMYLDISGNRIGNFDVRSLKSLVNLEILRLESNEMAEITSYKDIKEYLPELGTLGLSNNMFSCSYLADLMKELQKVLIEVTVPVSQLEFMFPNIKGVKCIKDVANVSEQLVSVDNIINMQDEGFKDDIRMKMKSIQEDINSQKQSLNNHDQQLLDVSKKVKDSIQSLQSNTNNQFNNLNKGGVGANEDLVTKLKQLQVGVEQLNKITGEKLEKISGNLESPKMDKLVTDTQGDIDTLRSKANTTLIVSVFLLIAVICVLGMLLKERYGRHLQMSRSVSQQHLTL